MFKVFISAIAAICLTACSTTYGNLNYVSQEGKELRSTSAQQKVVVGVFTDERDGDKNWLGVIRGGYGNHLKRLIADRPVTEIVQAAFSDGLRARGTTIATNNANQITGKILSFHADQILRSEGYAEIELTVRDQNGTANFKRTYSANLFEGSAFTLKSGIFASVENLRVLLQQTLVELIDNALDDPELRAALKI